MKKTLILVFAIIPSVILYGFLKESVLSPPDLSERSHGVETELATRGDPLDTTDSEESLLPSLPYRWLNRNFPSDVAKLLQRCQIAESFPPVLQEVVEELAVMAFDDDYQQIFLALQSEELRENADALTLLGTLYEAHLVPEVMHTERSDELAFSLYEKSAENGSSIGDWQLAYSYWLDFPSEHPQNAVGERLPKLLDEINWSSTAGFLLKDLYSVIASTTHFAFEGNEISIERAEELHREVMATCDVPEVNIPLAMRLINNYGLHTTEGVEGLTILQSNEDDATSQSMLGDVFSFGGLDGNSSYPFAQNLIDKQLALQYYIDAANLGDPDAAWRVYFLSNFDEEVQSDIELESRMLEIGSSLGDWRAIDEIALAYAVGEYGYSKDLNSSIDYVLHISEMYNLTGQVDREDTIQALNRILGYVQAEEGIDENLYNHSLTLIDKLISILEEDISFDDETRLYLVDAQRDQLIQNYVAESSAEGKDLASVEFGNYHALVIGNNQYEFLPNLESAVSDATKISEILENRYGFEVNLLLNATRTEIVSTLNSYRSTLGPTDNFLLYYAGHGQIDGETEEGFWQPVDAMIGDDTDWIGNDRITRTLRGFDSDNVLVIADSCYSGIVLRGPEQFENQPDLINADYIARLIGSKTRVALTSGGNEPVLDSLPGTENSIFALALLNTLEQNNSVITASDIYRRVSQDVVANLASLGIRQTPEFAGLLRSGHEGGDFVFRNTGINQAD